VVVSGTVAASTNPIGKLRRPGLAVELREFERETVLALLGEFDLTGIDVFDAALADVRPSHSLVLDLSELTFLDSSGIGAFVALGERATSEGWSLVLSAPQPPVAMVLRITGVAQRLTIVDGTV
jgi:anti-anti-sigma factor